MNIDEMKLKWQNSKLFDKFVEDVVAKKILEKNTRTRLDEMKREGKRSIYLSFLILVISLSFLFFLTKEVVSQYFFIAYGIIGMLLCLYTIYIQMMINRIDFATMTIEKASVSILRSRKHLILFSVAGGLMSFIFVGIFLYVYFLKQGLINDFGFLHVLKFALMIVFVFVISRYRLWKNYLKIISVIQQDLKLLQEYTQHQ